MKPICYILVGAPCSGKNTWVKNNISELKEYVVLSMDDLRRTENGKYVFQAEQEMCIYSEFVKQLEYHANMTANIVINNMSLSEYTWDDYRKILGEDYDIVLVILKPISKTKSVFRNIIRWVKTGRFTPISFIEKMTKIHKDIYENSDNIRYAWIPGSVRLCSVRPTAYSWGCRNCKR